MAIRVARTAGMPLKIAARKPFKIAGDPNSDADHEYYNEVIKPLLRKSGVEFIGGVGGHEKDVFLNDAAALLFPIRWPEPFGLVMAEALACGTPVVALRAGRVPEVIDHGRTGFIGDDEDDLLRGDSPPRPARPRRVSGGGRAPILGRADGRSVRARIRVAAPRPTRWQAAAIRQSELSP
jgi:hypothetical protein